MAVTTESIEMDKLEFHLSKDRGGDVTKLKEQEDEGLNQNLQAWE